MRRNLKLGSPRPITKPYYQGQDCPMCEGEPEPGWIEMDNNGPIGPCPGCNPLSTKEGQIDAAWRQHEQRRRVP